MKFQSFLVAVIMAFAVTALAQDPSLDAGMLDAGVLDAAMADAGVVDAGAADAGMPEESTPTVMPEDGAGLVAAVIAAARGGKWSLFVSFLIMLLVWGGTKIPFVNKLIKGKAKIWVAAVAGILAAFATSLFMDVNDGQAGIDWLNVIMEGLSVGVAAGGLWSLIGRKIMGQPIDADGDGVLDPAASADSEG